MTEILVATGKACHGAIGIEIRMKTGGSQFCLCPVIIFFLSFF